MPIEARITFFGGLLECLIAASTSGADAARTTRPRAVEKAARALISGSAASSGSPRPGSGQELKMKWCMLMLLRNAGGRTRHGFGCPKMKWCLLMLLRGAAGRTRHGFRNATRAVRLPVDGALQPIVALDMAHVGAALAAYGSRGRACAGSVVVKGRARGSHERNQDGLGAQVLRADQLAPLLLAHALTGLKIACRPHEWDFGDAYGEEGAMAIFGCGRGADGRTRGVGAFATSAELDRLTGTDARRRLIHDALRGAYLRAVPLLRPFVAQEAPPALACAAHVYAVAIDDFAMWDPDTPMTTFVGAAANRSFDLVRTVLRPQFDLVKAARPRPLDVWGDATVRVALHVRRGDVMPVESAARGAGVFPASDSSRPCDPRCLCTQARAQPGGCP